VIPGLGHDAGRLEQDCALAELRVDRDHELRLRAVTLGGEAVQALDAVLGVAAVLAHVPLAARAARARHGIRVAHDRAYRVALGHPGIGWRLEHAAERLVAEDEALLSGRRCAVLAAQDLPIRAAHADGQRLDQHRAVARIWLGDLVDTRRIGNTGDQRQSPHTSAPSALDRGCARVALLARHCLFR
jgi:hypothetical protein